MSDDELMRIVGAAVNRTIEGFSLVDVQVLSGSERVRVASATVKNHRTGREVSCSAVGTGPIEAGRAGCSRVCRPGAAFRFRPGEAAGGEAEVTVAVNGRMFRGSAVNQDVLLATAQAYMAACNQAVQAAEAANESVTTEAAEAP